MVDAFKTKSTKVTGGFNTSNIILGGRKMDKILKEQVIRINKKKVYFFNSEGIYTETSIEEAR